MTSTLNTLSPCFHAHMQIIVHICICVGINCAYVMYICVCVYICELVYFKYKYL